MFSLQLIRQDPDRVRDSLSKRGEDISIERLKARPVTTFCIDCKTKEEAFEKSLGL